MFRKVIPIILFGLGPGVGLAQQDTDNAQDPRARAQAVFERMDFDRDGKLNLQEFGLGSREMDLFDRRDADSDQRIDGREFQGIIDADYGAWDINGNGYLEESEYLEGLFNLWDTDRDSYLTLGEWQTAAEGDWHQSD